MLRSACRSLSLQRTVSGVLGGAVLAAAVAAPAAAEDELFLGYTDIRLNVGTMPFDGWSGGGQSGNYDSALRISLMAIGPVCSVLPINCYTPPRISSDGTTSSAVDTYGSYDDLVVERNYSYTDNRAYHYDWLLGFELSGNLFSHSEVGEPDITYNAGALSVHFGWGLEIATRTKGRWHWELTPFLGAGFASVEYDDGGANNDDELGLYYEVGGRLGSYYTWPGGLQIGGELRYVYSDADVDPVAVNTSYQASGPTFNLSLGYRF